MHRNTKMAVRIKVDKQEVNQKMNELEENFKLKKEMELMKFNKIGHNYELTKEQKEDATALAEKLTEILRFMNYFVELDPNSIIKDYKCSGSYKIIYSNYKIETTDEPRVAIRVSAKEKKEYYYFSNPELLPIFFTEIPSVIANYVKAKNVGLTQ